MRRWPVPLGHQHYVWLTCLVAVWAMVYPTSSARAIITSGTSGIDLTQFVGAQTFYDAGYTGSSAIVANIEAGFAWDQHVVLTHVTTQLADPSITGEYDRHATWTAHVIAGRGANSEARGIAYNATLWTGAIATNWIPPEPPPDGPSNKYSTTFNLTMASFAYPYVTALITGVNGQTADVINSSWTDGSGINGNDPQTLAIDGLAWQSGKLIVFAAGNGKRLSNGTLVTVNTINAPGSGTNAFVVGGASSAGTNPPYGGVASFSSRSPSDFWVPSNASGSSGTLQPSSRARVEILAPTTHFHLAKYSGPTGGNAFGGSTSTSTTSFQNSLQGTSFAAPTVAGGAALLLDAGKSLYPANPNAIDGRVLKAVMMNSADKLTGWTNNQQDFGGILITTQSLDYAQGTGRLNLDSAYSQYVAPTADLPGTNAGAVKNTGWDFGRIENGPGVSTQDYPISMLLAGGTDFTATLNWYSHEIFNTITNATSYGAFDNLDLQIWQTSAGVPTTLIAQSISLYNSTEHLHFQLPDDGFYLIRVMEDNFTFNFSADTGTDFGLAWNSSRLFILGDTDGDGDVDSTDLANVKNNFGLSSIGDADGDGDTDVHDFIAVKNNFGYTWAPGLQPLWTLVGGVQTFYDPANPTATAPSNSAPEPTSIALLLGAACGLAFRRKYP